MSIFLKIANKYSPVFNEERTCPDQYVGTVQILNGVTFSPLSNMLDDDFLVRVNLCEYKRSDSPIIILIIESPHISEFAGKLPRPAAGNGYGDAGSGIRKLFHEACEIHNHLPLKGYIRYFTKEGFNIVLENERYVQK